MTRRKLIRTLLSIVMALVVVYGLPYLQSALARTQPPPPPGYFRVVEAYDGDTIGVSMNGTIEKIRLIGVDTPETHRPNTPVQCYGPVASQLTKGALLGKNVRLEADPAGDNRDRYNRLLRYVYTEDGQLWNEHLISEGAGFAYILFPFTKKPEFMQAQFDAAAAKRGLWLACVTTNSGSKWQTNNL